MDLYKAAAKIIKSTDNIVFFGGAGVSTECGIPDFRSSKGLYNKEYNINYSPEEILSHTFFKEHPDIFYSFLKENMLFYNINPNPGHRILSSLEKSGKLRAVITQNIDGLHQTAGSKNVLELHGSLMNFYCSRCNNNYSPDYVLKHDGVPLCKCGSVIRPDIILYEEGLDEDILRKSIKYIEEADVLIVAGTSLVVYPAAGLLRYFKGNKMIFINKGSTSYDKLADIVINDFFSKTMELIDKELGN